MLIAKPSLTTLDNWPKQCKTDNPSRSWTWFGLDNQSPISTYFMPNNLSPIWTVYRTKNVIYNG